MTFSIIGTGNIAWLLGTRLVAARHHCAGIYARDITAAEKLSVALLADKFGPINTLHDEVADVCFLAISDSAISEVAAKLSLKQTVLVHTAGAVGLDVLKMAAKDHAVLWPVYSITKSNIPIHRNIPCAWEASTPKAAKYVHAMGHAVTDVLFEASYEQRKWLHLAAVMTNNFINHLLAIGEDICEENKLPFSALQPIIAQTFEMAAHAHPRDIQTGPAIRGDEATIHEHLSMLQTHENWQKIYEAMTNAIQHGKR